eukprot:1158773-Pelagomonas_calceolata.AAC.1
MHYLLLIYKELFCTPLLLDVQRGPLDNSGTALAKALELAKQAARAEGRMDLAAAGAPPVGAMPKHVLDEHVVRTA